MPRCMKHEDSEHKTGCAGEAGHKGICPIRPKPDEVYPMPKKVYKPRAKAAPAVDAPANPRPDSGLPRIGTLHTFRPRKEPREQERARRVGFACTVVKYSGIPELPVIVNFTGDFKMAVHPYDLEPVARPQVDRDEVRRDEAHRQGLMKITADAVRVTQDRIEIDVIIRINGKQVNLA